MMIMMMMMMMMMMNVQYLVLQDDRLPGNSRKPVKVRKEVTRNCEEYYEVRDGSVGNS